MNNGDFSPVDQYMASSSKNKFKLQYNSAYMIDFATPADLHYTVQFDTHMPSSLTKADRDFDIDVDFDKLDANEYPNTVQTVSFKEKVDQFAFIPVMDAKVQQAAVK